MERRDFGPWGLELDEGDFARALAALGVLYRFGDQLDVLSQMPGLGIGNLLRVIYDAEKNKRAITSCFYGYYGPLYQGARAFTARALAEAWGQFIEGKKEETWGGLTDTERVRLEITPHEKNLSWLVEQLSRPEVGAASVYVRDDGPSAEVGWNWPLQVGFLGDAASQAFRAGAEAWAQEESHWLGTLVEIVKLDQGGGPEAARNACDLLIIPVDLRAALASLLNSPGGIQADCVLLVGGARETPENVYTLVEALRTVVRTAGVGVTHLTRGDQHRWLVHLVRELSHNEPLDVALARACRDVEAPPPLLIGARRLMEFSRIARTIERMARQLAEAEGVDEKIILTDEEAVGLNLDTRARSARELGQSLRDGNFDFESELRAATAAVKLKKRVQPTLAAANQPEPSPRRILAQVYDMSSPGEERLLERALRANAPHALAVRIGVSRDGWNAANLAFPDDRLPADEDEHELTVVFSEPTLLLSGPQTATITLPRDGDSSECKFYFHVPEGVAKVEGRIVVAHRNRVLQTALLHAPVLENPYGEARGNDQIEVLVEVVVRPGMGDLDTRRRFDVAFVLNHDSRNIPGITTLSDKYAKFDKPDDLDSFISFIDSSLTGIANNPKPYEGGLTAPANKELLRDLAEYGRGLYESVVLDHRHNANVIEADYIQVISAKQEARLPIEFFYQREGPDPGADLCPGAVTALNEGKCLATCPTGEKEGSVVCPLGFWGLTKVIERHQHSPEFNRETINGDFRLQAEPFSERNILKVLTAGVVAASARADKLAEVSGGGVESVVKAIATVTGQPTEHMRVTTWDEWAGKVTSSSPPPSLLVLLTHTDRASNDLQQLFIEKGDDDKTRLRVSHIRSRYVRDPATNPAPLVLLMGCETGAPDISFLGFVPKFRRYGAAIIVSTGATVLGYQSVPVTREFIETLSEVAREGGAFGDVMRTVKRRMLARGLPMVLSLMAYGDADWRLA
ncbi:MAG TPA: hypothetical protein VF297_01760 [Pyrinomonadaceae bacterium]